MNPFQMGLKAFREGEIGNPFKADTQDYRDYEFGFNKAYFANQKRQVAYERTINKKGGKVHRGNTSKA